MLDNNLIEELKNTPLLLLTVKDKETIDYFNNLIPYSTGIEIECGYGVNYNRENFAAIPDIMHISNDSSEQRYRIPNGIRGIICLYFISIQLKLNSELNFGSGIHYHIDCTDCYRDLIGLFGLNSKIPEWVLEELDSWNYKGTYNDRKSSWIRFNSLETLEIRIGEMTFEYPLLLKRIIHCNDIVRRLKNMTGLKHIEPTYIAPDAKSIIQYSKLLSFSNTMVSKLLVKSNALQEELKKLEETNKQQEENVPIRQRTHRIE